MSDDYQRIARVIDHLVRHHPRQPDLAELAATAGLSEFHFQRLFTRWAGISPKRFLQFLTADHARALLRQANSSLATSLEAGLSGPGRLHDLLVTLHAVTPGELKAGGAGLTLRYGVHPSPFGAFLLVMSPRGVCALSFIDGDAEAALAPVRADWPAAALVEDPAATAPAAQALFARAQPAQPVALWVRGSNFQVKVWEALLRLPPGGLVSYQTLAERIGRPGAARAVGNAVGSNPIAFLIPCHRVIRASGVIGDYRWGSTRKRALLAWEQAQREDS